MADYERLQSVRLENSKKYDLKIEMCNETNEKQIGRKRDLFWGQNSIKSVEWNGIHIEKKQKPVQIYNNNKKNQES